jgi:RNA polymerase sigma-70 factor (ECF subfamily)
MTETRTKPTLEELERGLEEHRLELTGYCYRMLGSSFESEDAVQDTLLRAWRAFDRFDGRSSLRTWLYKIATNVCIDMLNSRNRRALPIDLSPATTTEAALAAPAADSTWIEPIPDGRVIAADADPAEVVELRESIRLAFVATVQHLPPKQRSVLILREVLRWSASEVAELLDTSVASVNSALQRARATMDASDLNSHRRLERMDEAQNVLLTRYVDAFERYDIESFVSLLHEDATHAMPPYPMWLQGPEEVHKWMLGPGAACEGSLLVPAQANGCPAFGQYRPSGPGGRHEPWALHVVEISRGAITGITYFLDTERLFPLFGLPQHPDD